MERSEAVAKGLSDIQSGEAQVISDALGAAFDANQSGSGGGFSQADVDAAVQAAKDADAAALADSQAADAKAQADAVAAVQGQLDGVTQALADMTAKEQVEEAAVQGFQSKLADLQSALDVIKGLLAG